MTLTEFLLARIDEDEAAARIANVSKRWRVDGLGCCVLVDHNFGDAVETHSNGTADHIARHDPARVLAECDAKRRIVEHLNEHHEWNEPYLLTCLALPYDDHPDYDETWRP